MRRRLLVWTVEIDLPATRAVYERIEAGASTRCPCPSCKNFDAVRPHYYPQALRQLLAEAGVPPEKEAAVRQVAPLEGGRHLYAGNYGFCGRIVTGRPYRGFPFLHEEVDVFERLAADTHVALRPWRRPVHPWDAAPCIRMEFLVVLPWVLASPETNARDLTRGLGRFCS